MPMDFTLTLGLITMDILLEILKMDSSANAPKLASICDSGRPTDWPLSRLVVAVKRE